MDRLPRTRNGKLKWVQQGKSRDDEELAKVKLTSTRLSSGRVPGTTLPGLKTPDARAVHRVLRLGDTNQCSHQQASQSSALEEPRRGHRESRLKRWVDVSPKGLETH